MDNLIRPIQDALERVLAPAWDAFDRGQPNMALIYLAAACREVEAAMRLQAAA